MISKPFCTEKKADPNWTFTVVITHLLCEGFSHNLRKRMYGTSEPLSTAVSLYIAYPLPMARSSHVFKPMTLVLTVAF